MARFVGITGITDSPAFPERRRRPCESDGFGVWAAVPPSRTDTGRNTSGGWGHAIQEQPKSVLKSHRISFLSSPCRKFPLIFLSCFYGGLSNCKPWACFPCRKATWSCHWISYLLRPKRHFSLAPRWGRCFQAGDSWQYIGIYT